nr:hypothetical protein [Cupriavidus sp. EM10]
MRCLARQAFGDRARFGDIADKHDYTVVGWERPHFKPGAERRIEVGRGAGDARLGRLPIGCFIARSDEIGVLGPDLAPQQVRRPTLEQPRSGLVDVLKLPFSIERHDAIRDVIEDLKTFHVLAPPFIERYNGPDMPASTDRPYRKRKFLCWRA